MSRSLFNSLNAFIVKRHRWIITAWIIALVASLSLVPSFFSSVSYNIIGGGFGAPSNSQSEKASNILKEQFPNVSNQSSSSILVVVQGAQPYSDALKKAVLNLNETISKDRNIANFTGESSLYTVEYSLLNSSLPSIIPQVEALESNLNSISTGVNAIAQNLTLLNTNLFLTVQGINQTAQLVYGIPSAFLGAWQGITNQGASDPYFANLQANATVYQITNSFGGDPNSLGYYSVFFNVWNSSFASLPSSLSALDREALSINQSVTSFLSTPQIDAQTKQVVTAVALGLNTTNWSQSDAITNLATSTLAANIPPQLSAQLGITPQALINQLYSFGPAPSNATILTYAINLTENSYTNATDLGASFSPSQLINEAVDLGPMPSFSQQWALASEFIANATENAFGGSPLFSINSTSLANLLSSLPQNATTTDVDRVLENTISNQSFANYPYQPTSAITKNFVSLDNNTVLIILSFSSEPDVNAVAQVKLDMQNSGLQDLGTIYLTGSPVLVHDIENAFTPALEITVGPGIAISLLIVGILFLAPIAALIPLLIGGISTVISLASIYFGVVIVGKGHITFLTPTLSILLLLGLAVDYAVLQLRRTREERQQGKSVEESVALSVRWAGQAVLTAGITVIVAYMVMAVVNVPIFSDVGTAIAISVSILLAASLTLLPALEIALKDKIFWPGLGRTRKNKNGSNSTHLRKLGETILKRKKVIAILITALALGAFYVEYTTPTGSDFLRLIPNFPSNQGLTVISNSFGSGYISPTTIVVTTPTQVLYGNNQFNQTLMDQLDLIAQTVANSPGVVSVTSPTRPFGSSFSYSELASMPEPLLFQYESQIYSMIGKDNKTVQLTIGLSNESQSQAAMASLLQTEKNVDKLPLINGVSVSFGGETQSAIDSQAFMANLLPKVIVVLSIAVYIILFVQLRSAFTPLRLIFTILCSVAFALAILSAIFYYGINLPILDFAPLFVVVTMLGVGIDYDIFFVTRIREEALKGSSDDEAIKTAVEKVWVTILGLGLVLSTVFASLLITGIAILQEISLAVSAAIIIDVLVVILFFVPSLMGLAQKLNWWPHKPSKTPQTQQGLTKNA